MSTTAGRNTSTAGRPLVSLLAMVVGAVFLLVGILGFIPGITTDFDQMKFATDDSGAQLLGLFQVSILHNIVHLLFGVAGLAMARRADTARTYLIGGGAIYLVLWIYGLLIDTGTDTQPGTGSAADFVPLNDADNWLHLLLGIGMIAMGLATRERNDERRV